MKSAIDILREALREMGAEGLCNGSCACALDDLAWCLGPCNSCVPAKRGPVPVEYKDEYSEWFVPMEEAR